MEKFIRLAITYILTIVFTACGAVTPYVPKQANTLEAPSTISTSSPISLPTLTPKPTDTFTSIDNYVGKIKNLSENCDPILDLSQENLPSVRDWVIYTCRKNRELFIIKVDGSKAWQVAYEQLSSYEFDEHRDDIYTVHWSNDGRYVYFVPAYCCWDPGIAFVGQPLDEVWQFDVITGTRTQIMSGFDDVSFSPNDKWVLFIPQMSAPPPIIQVYDLEKHEISRSIVLSAFPNNASTGMVVWAPNGHQFAVLTASGADFERYEEGDEWKEPLWSVLAVDLNTLSQKVVVSKSKKDIHLLEITDGGILLLTFNEYKADGSSIRTDAQYDLELNKFITPTPSP